MKKILIYISVAVVMFSCKKDAEHHLREKFPLIITQQVINIDNSGVTFVGSVERHGKETITDHGFVWGIGQNSMSGSLSLGALDNEEYFQARVTYDLKSNQNYYVRAYMKTNDYVVYGDQQSFISLGSSAPIIERIGPDEITCYMNKITIYGKNFCSNIADAKIDNWNYSIKSISQDSIVIQSNNINLGTNTFNLSIFDKTIPVTFEAVGLIIESINPQPAEIGSVVYIKGKYLSDIREIFILDAYVGIGIVEKNDTEVKVKIPVLKEGQSIFRIRDSKYSYYNVNHEFDISIDVLSPWKTFDLPSEFDSYGPFCNYQDKLYTLNKMTIYQLDMQNKTYQSIAKMPEAPHWTNVMRHFMIGSKFYICTQSDLFLSYDIESDTWEKLPAYTNTIYEYPIWYNTPVLCFSIGDKGYAVSHCSSYGKNTLVEYDSSTKTWKEISNVDYIFHPKNLQIYVTTCNGKAYISSNDRIWEFDKQTYSLQEIIQCATGLLFTYNDKIYMYGKDFIEYDLATNQIKQLPRLSYVGSSPIFLWKSLLYVGCGYSSENNKYEYLAFDLDEL